MENNVENNNVNEEVKPVENTENEVKVELPNISTEVELPSSEETTSNEQPTSEENNESKQEPTEENKEQSEENQGLTAEEQMAKEMEQPKSRPIKNPDAFNSNEKVLLEIKEEKQKSPIFVLIFFAVLIAFILFLPSINEYVQKRFGPQYTRKSSIAAEEQQEVKEEVKNKFHDATNRVSIGDIDVFQVGTIQENDEYFVTFTIFNKADITYTYNKKYYLVLYEEERPLFRALIHSFNYIPAYGSDEIKLVINQNAFNNADNFKLEEINTSLYQNVELTNKEDNYMVLTCNYKNDTMKYYFIDNMLEKISETYTVSSNNPNYYTLEDEYKAKSATYNNMQGIESIFYGKQDGFEMLNTLTLTDIQDIDLTNLKVYRFFKFRENSKIVAFEMTAQGYICG